MENDDEKLLGIKTKDLNEFDQSKDSTFDKPLKETQEKLESLSTSASSDLTSSGTIMGAQLAKSQHENGGFKVIDEEKEKEKGKVVFDGGGGVVDEFHDVGDQKTGGRKGFVASDEKNGEHQLDRDRIGDENVDGLTKKLESSDNVDDGGGSSELNTPRRSGRLSKIESEKSKSHMNGDMDHEKGIDGDTSSSVSQRTRGRVTRGKKYEIKDVDVEQMESKILDDDEEGHLGFSVGDFVWGKIKSHPWWPGRVYDPSGASEYALKYKHEGRLLVAYFGDGTFAWCDSSQLLPFEENFEELSKQSNTKSFVHALEEAVNELVSLVELQLSGGSQSSLPVVANAGIKHNIHVPLCGVEKSSLARFDPAKMLAGLKLVAKSFSVANILELAVFKSRISALCNAKGVNLESYHEPLGIEGLLDNEGVPEKSLARGPVDGDWFPEAGCSSPTRNGPETPDDKSHKKRKEKTIAELLGSDTKIELEGETQSVKLASRGRKKKQKITDENQAAERELNGVESDSARIAEDSEKLVSKSGRKRRKISAIDQSTVADGLIVTRSTARKKEASARTSVTEKNASSDKMDASARKDRRKLARVPSLKIDNGLMTEEMHERVSPREKKKSKYLSPPYTSLQQRQRISTLGSEANGLEFSDVTKMGERMTKAAGKLMGSPPSVKCSSETFRRTTRGSASSLDRTDSPNLQTAKKDRSDKVKGSVKNVGSPDSVLCEIRSAALDPLYARTDDTSFDTTRGFLSSYRSSHYKNGLDYNFYKKQLASHRKRKRNLSDGNVLNQVDEHASEPKMVGRRSTRKKDDHASEPKSIGRSSSGRKKDEHSSAPKSVGRRSSARKNDENPSEPKSIGRRSSARKKDEQSFDPKLVGRRSNRKKEGKSDSNAALVMTFPREFSLPSKEDLIKTHSKFGVLDESRTEVVPESSTAKVVFVKSSEAEIAMGSMQKNNPFGAANVSYGIQHLTAVPKSRKISAQNKKKSITDSKVEGKSSDKPPPPAPEDEPLAVVFIKQKLKGMTSMLAQSDGKMSHEIKSNLESEVKELLKKVKMMTASSSSASS